MNLISLGDKTITHLHDAFALCLVANNTIDLTYKNASMQTVYRLLIKFLCESYDPAEEYVAIIGIPTNKRLELREDTGQSIDFFDNNYFNYYPKSKDFPKLIYSKFKKFNGQIFEATLINERHAALIFGIENLLEANNIKFIMYNVNEKLHSNTVVPKQYFEPYNAEKTFDYLYDGRTYTQIDYVELLEEHYNANYS